MIESRSADGSTVQNLYIQPNGNTAFATTSGNVGIGTTSPSYKLEVKGSSGNISDGNQIFSVGNTIGGTQLSFGSSENSYNWIRSYESGAGGRDFVLGTNAEVMRLTADGKVGIGTTSPNAKFHAIGHTMFSGGAYQTGYNTQNGLVIDSGNVTSASGAYGAGIEFTRLGDSTIKKAGIAPIQETADSDSIGLSFHTARTTTTTDPTYEAMRLTHDSKVGIGESAPASRLEVKGTAMSQFRMQTAGGPSTTNDTSGNVGDMAYDDDHLYIKTVNGWGRVALDFAF